MYTFEQCKKLELEIGTPAYLVNEDLFLNNLRDIGLLLNHISEYCSRIFI